MFNKKRILKKMAACTLAATVAVSAAPLIPGGNAYAADTVTLNFTDSGITASSSGSGYSIDGNKLSISEAGTYKVSGSCSNGSIEIGKGLQDVTLVLNGLSLTSTDTAPIVISKNTSANISVNSTSSLTDAETDADSKSYEGAAVKVKSASSVTFSGSGTLNINGSSKNGIKGAKESSVTFNSGTYKVKASNNGIAADGSVTVNNGSFVIDTDGDGIKADPDSDDTTSAGTVTINGGSLDIDAEGDGIQAVAVNVNGGSLDIDTSYDKAGTNYYNKSLGTGNYNTLSGNDTTKTEVVNVDTGSHKGIKAGIKAKTYSYKSVASDSTNTAGTKYTQAASGGLNITGGTIDIDTTASGIKYNAGGGMNGGSSGSGNTTAVDGKVVLGAADDGIKSNNNCTISGGTIKIKAADDGISTANTLSITGSANIDVSQAYEGIEAKTIVVGTGNDNPSVNVYSYDDCINTAGKSYTYVYDDEDEEKYTKTTVSSSNGNDMTVNSGNVTVMVGDDTQHSYSAEGTSVTFQADGDGIDCNGSFYAKGGKIIVWGPLGNGNSPVDTADSGSEYVIAKGAELLAAGSSSSMVNNPTSLGQAAAVFSGASVTKGNTLSIKSGSSTLFSASAPKTVTYVLYSSPSLTSGSSYSLYNGNNSAATATASTAVSGGGSGFDQGQAGPGGQPGSGGQTGPGNQTGSGNQMRPGGQTGSESQMGPGGQSGTGDPQSQIISEDQSSSSQGGSSAQNQDVQSEQSDQTEQASDNNSAGGTDQSTEESTTASKKANTLTASGKSVSVKYSKLKKGKVTLAASRLYKVSKAKGTVTYTKVSGNSKITVNSKTGKITIKKGLKKGTYTVKVKIKAAGNNTYKAKTKTVAVKVTVK